MLTEKGKKMDDLISRQAAIENIKECAQAAHSNYEWDMEQGYINAIECLEELPSAQPEIIRCKECKYQNKFFHEDKRRKEGGYYIFGCELADEYSHVCLDDDFCSRAERKTDE